VREGLEGISPRYVQDRIAAALVGDRARGCLTGFDVLDSLVRGLQNHPLIDSDEVRKRYAEIAGLVRDELEAAARDEVRAVVAADVEAVQGLCGNYVDAVTAAVDGGAGDERLMRSIEEKIGVTEARKGDFRREIVNYIDALAGRGESFTYLSNPRLRSALELKLFEDCRDTLRITAGSSAVDRDAPEKVAVVAARLVRDAGYCEACAGRLLEHVGALFARAEARAGAGEA
jgi:serine protein kinase